MTTFGKNIRIYLKDGTVTGIRFGEIINQTIQLIACPRNRVTELKNYDEAKKQGIYFLFGNDEKTGDNKAYIGEGYVLDRLQRHVVEKDFWNEVVLFVSKDENLTKGHVKYLESRSIQVAKNTKRYTIENDNLSTSPLPMADQDAMEEFFVYIKLLLGVFGHKFLEELNPTVIKTNQDASIEVEESQTKKESKIIELILNSTTFSAKAIQTDEGIVVLQGSEASTENMGSMQIGYKELKEKLITNGTLLLNGSKYIFQKNYLFNSSSAAAVVIVGHSISGPQNWRDNMGRSLKYIEEAKLRTQEA